MKSVVVTGADRGIGSAFCKEFLNRGFRVFAGQFMPEWPELGELAREFPDAFYFAPLDVSSSDSVGDFAAFVSGITNCVDILINNAGIGGSMGVLGGEMNFAWPNRLFDVNSLGPLRMVEAFLPLMQMGMKRLCFMSSEMGSISLSYRKDSYAYSMSKAALNMAIRRLHNQLYGDGFTFRVYHPGWVSSYMSGKKSTDGKLEPEETVISALEQFLVDFDGEDCLRMLDNEGVVLSF